MRRSDARDLRRPLLFRAGSAAGQIAARLSGQFDLVPLRPGDPIAVDGPAVFLVERALRDLGRAAGLPGRTKQLALIALLPPGPAPKTIPARWYACLPRNAPPAVLAKILDNAFEHMATRGDLDRLSVELRDLNSIGVRLSAERDLKRLLELILTKAREITHSDAGSLYLVEESDTGDRRLRFTLTQNDSVDVPFEQFTIPINGESVAGYVALTGQVVNLADAYHPPLGSTFKVNRAFDTQIGYRTKSMLVVPMKTQKEEIIGVLQLINCKPDLQRRFASPAEIEREVEPFGARYTDFAVSLASQAAVSLENSRLYENIQTLFEGFVKASVTAIESRDPTTSGHSFRVAELTVGLAEIVDRAPSGPYGDVHFSPDEMKEIRYASLLHDFGKVGVREEVLVKAKKLYPNHLELIKQRVEIIRRGLELKYSRRKIEYLLQKGREQFAAHAETLDAELASFLAELDAGLSSVIVANEPSVMPEDFASAIQRFALQSFEDHLGRPQSIITPEEAKVLAIPRGTLTETERKQIESHDPQHPRDRPLAPREAERIRIPVRDDGRPDPHSVQDHDDLRYLRRADRGGPSLQEGHLSRAGPRHP
ncbi:MAG: HD family phosphohydrolase [Candidatus Rokuibacteriota bacterium]|nr:MAG: HD family phosphohydrolase [Candidatus Rokubacteria bacterium]